MRQANGHGSGATVGELPQPLFGLLYLAFVFVPLAFMPAPMGPALLASLLATAAFVPLYLFGFRVEPRGRVLLALAIAALGYALLPLNPGGNTFTIYAMAMLARVLVPARAVAAAVLLFALLAVEFWLLMPSWRLALGFAAMVAVIGTMVVSGVLLGRLQARRNAELRLSQDEVRRIAAMAERERIGRDLHDLLGHTLSLVVLKSELAGRLLPRDGEAAAAQIRDVEQVARKALAELREAVSGIRAGSIEAELAAARLALLGADVRLDQRLAAPALTSEVDAALALAVREAITNVLRHAQARRVEVELAVRSGDALELSILDDGTGGSISEGNGLAGMRERLAAIGAALAIDSGDGGCRLRVRVPAGWRAPPADGGALA